jgi:glycosyltransferase involved in cell wall biosynthesis
MSSLECERCALADDTDTCKLSYAILTHNEEREFSWLMEAIQPFLTDDSEIIVVDDFSTPSMVEQINSHNVKFFQRSLNNDFAAQRNFANSQCQGKFIFVLDPDEIPPPALLKSMSNILEQMDRDRLDACIVPRFNQIVDSDQPIDPRNFEISDAAMPRHSVEDHVRIYRNSASIAWIRPLHEKLTGCRRVLRLPASAHYSILHIKTRRRAESQVAFYNSHGSRWANLTISIKFSVLRVLQRAGLVSLLLRIARGHLVEVMYRGQLT